MLECQEAFMKNVVEDENPQILRRQCTERFPIMLMSVEDKADEELIKKCIKGTCKRWCDKEGR